MNVRDVSESWGDSANVPQQADDTPFLPRLLFSLRRRAVLIALVWAVTVAGAALAISLQPPQYRAEATLEIRPEQPILSDPSDPSVAGSLQLWDSYFRTQASLLQSRKLLERVLGAVPPPIAQDYKVHEDPVQALANQLEVETVPSTFIVRVGLTHHSAERGPEIVNALVTAYQEDATGRWRELKSGAADLLDRETLPALQRKMDESDKDLQRFHKETGFADFDEQVASLLDARKKVTGQLVDIRLKKVRLQSERDALSEVSAENLVGLFDPALQGTRVLEPLLTQRATLEAQIAAESLVYKDKHPRLMALRRQLQEVRGQLQGVVQAAVKSLDRELLAAVLEEKALQQDQTKIEKEMADSRVRLTEYKKLEEELKSAREVYNAYLKKADDTKATSKGGLASVRVVDMAKSPANSSGKGRVLLTVAAVIGLLFGLTSAVLAEELDDRITAPRQIEVFLGVDVLGLIPRLNRNAKKSGRPDAARAPLILTDDPGSLNLEVFRMLRAEVSSRLERVPGGRVIAVAGPGYGEGKSTVAVNLARVLAMEDRRVLLIDGDLRRPHLKALLARRNGMGLEEYLRGERDLRGAVQASRLPQVDVIGAQQELYRPAEEAGSERFRSLLREARELYDYVIIDAGAVNVISEVATMARQADGTLLVLQKGETRRRQVRLAKRRLFGLGSRLLGAVLNGVPSRPTDLRRLEPELPPDFLKELESGDELVAIVEQELLGSPRDGAAGGRK
ncbi:MAG TPA: polysaccharide biosynthesis tyrosine autokinase [Planctomycetota bacterium]|jgi:capsular exopolysaccharide synthesis family protein|nr:polysaccharide biosynthesis tyrosine autokinase [Planctomycetota bacterium]